MIPLLEDVRGVQSNATFIMILEKDFMSDELEVKRFTEKFKCIIVTGKGFPYITTRIFLRYLVDNLQISVYALVDCDPSGIEIACCYWFDSDE